MSESELKLMRQLIEELAMEDLFDDLDAGSCSSCCSDGGTNGNKC